MSTLKVNTVLSADTPTVNITDGLNVTGVSTVANITATTVTSTNIVNATQLSHRNIVINGAMMVAQRGTSSTSSGYQTVDRQNAYSSGTDETPTQAQVDVSSGTDPYNEGFRKALKFTNGNQTSGAQGGSRVLPQYKFEGQDLVNSGWNHTSSSSYITIQFWVRSSIAQTYYGYLRSQDGTNQIYTYSVALSANTWTKVTKTIPGNSNIQIDNDNGEGIQWNILIPFIGTSYTDNSVSLNQWNTYAGGTRTPDNTSTWYTTNDATFELTGLQLEVGSVATPFEHKTYAQELNACMRYYEGIYMGQGTALFRTYTNSAGSPSNCSNVEYNFKVEKRAQPTWAVEGNAQWAPANSTTAMSAYPSKSTCLFQRNDTSHQFLSDANGDLCGSFSAEI